MTDCSRGLELPSATGLLRRFAPRNDGAVVTLRRHCERSEAIQLFFSRRNDGLLSWAGVALRKAGLLRRFAPRNDGAVVTLRRHCERSEAIQLCARGAITDCPRGLELPSAKLDCFVASLLAVTGL